MELISGEANFATSRLKEGRATKFIFIEAGVIAHLVMYHMYRVIAPVRDKNNNFLVTFEIFGHRLSGTDKPKSR
jgi:hypothetical protein